MDNQLALMKKLQKDHDTIAYAHNEEIVLIKRVAGNDGVRLTEVTLNPENGNKISERNIPDYEMKLTDFDSMKQLLTEETRQDFNVDWSVTKLNVDIDKLDNTDILSTQSVEDDYIERQNVADNFRTLENAMKVLDSCLTKIQKKDTPQLTTEYRDAGEDPVRTSRRIGAPRLRKDCGRAIKLTTDEAFSAKLRWR